MVAAECGSHYLWEPPTGLFANNNVGAMDADGAPVE